MNVQPTCRYGHGPLMRPDSEDDTRWVFGVTKKTEDADGKKALTELPYAFTVLLYRCPICGYIELFDDES